MKIIYIAGKVTGLPVQIAKSNFDLNAIYLEQKGFKVINPMKLITDEKTEWHTAMKICISELVNANAVLLLDNYKDSNGATLEKQLADILKIPTFLSTWDIVQFFRNR